MKKPLFHLMAVVVALLTVFTACNKDDRKEPSQDDTIVFTIGDAPNVCYNSATFNASVSANTTITGKGICYSSQNTAPTTENPTVSGGSGTGNYTVRLINLTEDTDYYVRLYAIMNGETYYGEVKTFTTLQKDKEEEGVIINGIRWATRNLDAGGIFVEKPEDFGGFYQWGRRADGHEQPMSNTTTILSSTDTPSHGNFILPSSDPYDWRDPRNNNLWGAIKTAHDPCPCGWRVPTYEELESLATAAISWGELNGVTGYFFGSEEQTIFLPAAGRRYSSTGALLNLGTYGCYWSSRAAGWVSDYLYFDHATPYMYPNQRAFGFSIRCVAE